ncbi:extracellular solute-binding protein [Actinoplanes sp. NBRC 101535]|uniref:ABC transporter substrate-binding protein n=1 Tax=Actinoplanes sp. NBRC 101535 TaxID=3032196 RepID=UPI0024A4147F|nr:extracellular solute-binding protein [Actinoplanes sp. NBRC 101535]GLY03831.1 hypothetical protein Acsp01_42100 [Actinoplanes sp. NBRC 101535]
MRRFLTASVVLCLALTGCSAGSLGSSEDDGDGVTLTFLVDNSDTNRKLGEGLATAFAAANPGITVKVEIRPQGTEGDNLIKTRLATGDMTDVFQYNSGSLMQALAPAKNLVAVGDQPWAAQLDQNFTTSVTADGKVYAAPFGNYNAGAILYNRAVYARLGLTVPVTWAEFEANNAALKAAGIAPVVQSYGETWTSQLFILGDFHNVSAADPRFAEKYTANQVKYASTPAAVAGFQHLQRVHDAGWTNEDFASAKLDDAIALLAEGKGAHYPILSGIISQLAGTFPDKVDDIGLFAVPGTDAAKNGLTVWAPAGVYLPASTTDAKREAALKFLAFVASPAGCDAQTAAAAPQGPFALTGCTLPDSVPQAVKDMQTYLSTPGRSSLALEFLSPVKGPALEQICVEVGSGIRDAKSGAELYDEDVKKQAQQLGLTGW